MDNLEVVLKRLHELVLKDNWLTSLSDLQKCSNLLVLDIG